MKTKGKKIPRKTVNALVAAAALAALDRFERGEADDEDTELLQNSLDYLATQPIPAPESHKENNNDQNSR